MSVTTERPKESDDLDVRVLFPEARQRRRRLRITAGVAVLSLVAVVVAVIASDRSGLFGHVSKNATGSIATSLDAGQEHVTSVLFTETEQVANSSKSLLFDVNPVVKVITDTTLGSPKPSEITHVYSTTWTQHPTLQSTGSLAFEQNGVYFGSNSAEQLRICTESTDGAKDCSVTTKSWIVEKDWRQLNTGSPLQSIPPQAMEDPTKLFAELQSTVRKLERVGSSKIGGVETTEYRGNLPAQKVKQWLSAPSSERPVLELAISGPNSDDFVDESGGKVQQPIIANFKNIPIQIWVDSQNVVRQIRLIKQDVGFSLQNQNQRRLVPLVVTFDYTNFNQPVTTPSIPKNEIYVVHGKIVSESVISKK